MKNPPIATALLAFATLGATTPQGGYGGYRPRIDSKSYQATVKEAALFKHAQKLQDFAYSTADRNRNINSYGHNATVDYLFDTLSALGYYNVERQPFQTGKTTGYANLTVDGQKVSPVNIFDYTPGGDVTAPLELVANLGCDASDYPANLTGKIALIHRGTCEMGQKSAFAGGAGAVGAIMWNNMEGPLENRTLGAASRPEGPYVPTVGITQADGQGFQDRILAGEELTASLFINANNFNITVENVLATTKGGDHDNVYQLGGHTDSVGAGPGINDDGSGTISLLELAIHLTKYSTNNAIRFSFWAAEEEGLLGSYYYTDTASEETLSKIRLFGDFDMLASPNYIYAVYDGDGSSFNLTGPPGSDYLEQVFIDWFKAHNLPTVPCAFDGRSDYAGFIDHGIPAGGLFTGAEEIKTAEEQALFGGQAGVAYDINYHGAGDNVANCNGTAWVTNTKAIAHTIAKFGTSWKGIPKRNATKPARKSRSLGPDVGRIRGNAGVGRRTAKWLDRRI